MAAFLEDYSAFVGNGKCNENGQNLDEYLEQYDPSKYRAPSVTADILVFRYNGVLRSIHDELSLLMVKRRNHPCIGNWALPGGFCNVDEDLDAAAKRELFEETGLSNISIEQLNTWGEVWRDPRDRIITTSYIAVVNNKTEQPVAGDDAAQAEWFDVKLTKLFSGRVNINDREINKTMYQISLSNNKFTGLNDRCTAKVVHCENAGGILKEETYKVLESNNIAFDHARFIINGLLHLKKSLRN